MNLKFEYDFVKDYVLEHKAILYIYSINGVLLSIYGIKIIIDYFNNGNVFLLLLGLFVFLGGIAWLTTVVNFGKPFLKINQPFLKVNNEEMVVKLDPFKRKQKINLKEVREIEIRRNQINLHLANNKKVSISASKIKNENKRMEFVQVMNYLKTTYLGCGE